jgi:HAE1 family hydrophobic/amphiphilic exporter-1
VTIRYSNGVKQAIKKAPLVLIILLCIFIGTGWMFTTKPTGFIPSKMVVHFSQVLLCRKVLLLHVPMKSLKRLKPIYKTFPEIKYVTTISGINILNRAFKSNGATVFVSLKPWETRTRTANDIAGMIMGKYMGYTKAGIGGNTTSNSGSGYIWWFLYAGTRFTTVISKISKQQ